MVERGEIDISFSNPFAYIRMARYGARAFARIIEPSGKPDFKSQIICRRDNTAIRTLADCRGKRWIAVDPSSAGGYLYALGEFLDNGLKRSDFSEIQFSPRGPGRQSRKRSWCWPSYAGTYDIGSIRDGTLDILRGKNRPSAQIRGTGRKPKRLSRLGLMPRPGRGCPAPDRGQDRARAMFGPGSPKRSEGCGHSSKPPAMRGIISGHTIAHYAPVAGALAEPTGDLKFMEEAELILPTFGASQVSGPTINCGIAAHRRRLNRHPPWPLSDPGGRASQKSLAGRNPPKRGHRALGKTPGPSAVVPTAMLSPHATWRAALKNMMRRTPQAPTEIRLRRPSIPRPASGLACWVPFLQTAVSRVEAPPTVNHPKKRHPPHPSLPRHGQGIHRRTSPAPVKHPWPTDFRQPWPHRPCQRNQGRKPPGRPGWPAAPCRVRFFSGAGPWSAALIPSTLFARAVTSPPSKRLQGPHAERGGQGPNPRSAGGGLPWGDRAWFAKSPGLADKDHTARPMNDRLPPAAWLIRRAEALARTARPPSCKALPGPNREHKGRREIPGNLAPETFDVHGRNP